MNILLTFTGFHDPYALGLIGGEEVPGPVLSLLAVRNFDQVILFDTPNTRESTRLTNIVLELRHPNLNVAVRNWWESRLQLPVKKGRNLSLTVPKKLSMGNVKRSHAQG